MADGYISQITLPNNNTYLLKDSEKISAINASGTAPLTLSSTKSGTTYALTGSIADASFTTSGIVNTSTQVFGGGKTLRFTSRIYPLIGTSAERSQWYKITFPYSTITTGSSAQWFMNSFDLHFGGGYASNPSGVAHVTFYWTRAANNGAWAIGQQAALIEGILANKIGLYYRIAEPGVLYVNNTANTYNGIWIDNLYVDDTAINLNWSTITITATAAITESTSPKLSDYTKITTSYLYNDGGTLKTDSNFEGKYIKGTWLYTSAATAKTSTAKLATIESDNFIYYITPANALKSAIGTTAIGAAKTPIYWDGSKFTGGTALKDLAYKDSLTASDIPDLSGTYVKKVTSTDNAIARFDGTNGQVQNSGVTIDDSDNMAIGSNRILNQTTVPGQGEILLSVFGFKTGYPLYTDPTFLSGMNSVSVYNNSGGGTVTHTRGSYDSFEVSSPGTGSSAIIKIETTGTASPGCGGFVQSIPARANAQFIQIFRALVPADRKLYIASNPMGTSFRDEWLTSNNGTGKWEWYARRVVCGQEGNMSSGGHVYIDGSAPVTWYLASCNVYDITKTEYDGLKTRYADRTNAANITSTQYGIAYYSDTTGTFSGIGAGTNGQYLKSNGTSAPTWASFGTTLSSYGITNAVQYNGIDNAIGSSATAANAKAYWANNNKVPTGKVVFNYNSSGTEFTTLFSNNNNAYGSILRWGYQDAYIRILRAHPGQTTHSGWYTEDWEKISAGYADTAPWSGISNKPTTLSGYGITDAKIASGVITLGSNTITPITNIAELTGSTITAANLRTNLGLSAALRFIGKATTDMSESTTTAPTVTEVTNYVPEVGDVILDKNSDAEYVCIAKNGSTYTWELLGRSGSWATSTHTHGNITNGGLLGAASMAVVTDGSKKITTADLSVSDSNASTNATTTFVQAVTQNAQGQITVTKASLNTSGTWSGTAGTANKLAASKTIWGQTFDGSANVTGNLIDVGNQIKLLSGQTELQFLTSAGGAANGKFGKLGLNTTYANVDFTNYILDVNGKARIGALDGGQHVINGNVQLNSQSGSYNEGLRINRSTTGYANIYLGGTRSSASGNQTGGWWIGTLSTPADATSNGDTITNTVFTISNNNTADTLSIRGTRGATIGTNSGWAIRPRLAVGTTYQTGYTFYVNGTSFGNDSITLQKAGEVGLEVKNTQSTNPNQVAFIVGSSGNGGIYSRKHSKWIVYADASGNIVLNGNANTATSAGKWTTARTLTIGSTGKSVDGSGNVSWSLADIGAAASSHTHNESDITWSNGTLYTIGDDIYIGDINQAGHLGLKSKQAGNTGLAFIKQATANDTAISAPSGTTIGKITWDGTKFSITSTTAIAGTITNATNATSATNATALYTASAANTAEDGQDARIKAAIKSYFDNNTASVPRGKTISLSISTGNGVQATGYFISGYDSNPYGGFFISHYDTPRYVGISNGNYSCYELVRNNGGTYSINVSGTAGGVAWTNVSGRPTNLNQFTNGPGYVTSSGVTKVSTGAGLTGGDITATGTISIAGMNTSSGDTTKALSQKGTWETFLTSHSNGYGKITSGAVSTTTTSITTNTATIEANSANEKLTIKAGNKWIQTGVTNSNTAGSDVITLGHFVPASAISNLSTTAQTPAFGNTFNIPTINLDEAGHVTSVSNATVKIPELPSSMTPSAHTHGNISNTGTLGTTASYGVATDANKKIIAIDLTVDDPAASGNATTFVTSVTQSSQGKISVSRSTVPNASSTTAGIVKLGADGGAATYSHTHSGYLTAHGKSYGGIQVSAQSTTSVALASSSAATTVTAVGANETVKFVTKNKWIVIKGVNSAAAGADEVQFAHTANLTAKTSYCSTSATASANGGKITVTDIQYDEAGHITSTTDRTITLSQTTYSLSSLGAASSTHTHGNISNTGTISTSAAPVNGDAIVISTSANGGLVKKTNITFDGSTTSSYLNKKGDWGTPPDTKNTAGSTATATKIFLIGATAQSASPQTYSTTFVYATDGVMSAEAFGINHATTANKVTLQWNNTDSSLDFVFA